MFAVKECDSCATFETWLNISSGPLVALVSKLMLCFHHLEQVSVFTPAPRVIMIGLFLEMSDNLDIDGDDDNCCTLLMQFFYFLLNFYKLWSIYAFIYSSCSVTFPFNA